MPRFVAIVGCQHYWGTKFLRPGMTINMVKEKDNDFDDEAIKAVLEPLGCIGYVANSFSTVPRGCHSAGRIYDTFHSSLSGIVRFVLKDMAIVEIESDVSEQFTE